MRGSPVAASTTLGGSAAPTRPRRCSPAAPAARGVPWSPPSRSSSPRDPTNSSTASSPGDASSSNPGGGLSTATPWPSFSWSFAVSDTAMSSLAAMDPLAHFTPETRAWFEAAFEHATPAQELGWPAIASGEHVLIQAPTGSGKTLAAFLYGIDRLNATPGEGLQLVYVSPLKALNYDIERNLRGPLAGLRSQLRVGVRTGDTPQRERAAMLREPRDILITTPESLFLLLTSRARELLAGVRTLILDEVHAVAGTKRGAHLAISVERLQRLVGDEPLQRLGLSATQRPLEEIGRFVAGGREIELVDAGRAK